ncbi:uncharacterized protein BDZ99DRAFT_520959 [Mytilinidion resinicola]|uniref:Uncharacterized protein n=1 Tax=Mytilinidion resinicola TaxID=574789 RepID=A0A6A6YP25_9PEZI|nr:uncharacterized protein BDZ99DRAFT_520959 [Mytilinidion resinicola]KAF2809617.1 hypothetical protein BDZ99DRAFT_520959 [Mytilinidion resinicola]
MQRTDSQKGGGGRSRAGSKSNRDPDKEFPEAMSPKVQAHRPDLKQGTAFYLVVCGATSETDSWMWSDFMAYTVLLRGCGINGTFLNCLDLDKIFGFLSHDNHKDIRFGQVQGTDEPLLKYTRLRYTTEPRWWEQVDPDDLMMRVWGWVVDVMKRAVPGDAVNIIVEAHGNELYGAKLGTKYLSKHQAGTLCNKFQKGVQVNFIVGACHSGIFTDIVRSQGQEPRYISSSTSAKGLAMSFPRSVSNRVRNMKFAQAWVQSLARVTLPGLPDLPRQPSRSLAEHENFLRQMTYRSVSGSMDDYQSYIAPNDLTQLVEEMVFREKIDFLYDPAVTSSRRRIEVPALDETIMRYFLTPTETSKTPHPQNSNPQGLVAELKAIVVAEKAFCNPDTHLAAEDIGVLEVLDVFHTLVSRGLLLSTAIQQPVDLVRASNEARDAGMLLGCLEGFQDADGTPCPYHLSLSDILIWFAIIILRGYNSAPGIVMETILDTKFLGGLNRDRISEYREISDNLVAWRHDPNHCVAPPGRTAGFGFWLPHNADLNSPEMVTDALLAGQKRFNRIERCFRDWFGVPENILQLEQEQERYFERHPERAPGSELRDIRWWPAPEADEAADEAFAGCGWRPFSHSKE